ncbi:MAG: hypothetical protein JNK00_06055 [Flavipsychrobacter sp.]|nr:hypothetical protein [Flavipsychrobacter sp.]
MRKLVVIFSFFCYLAAIMGLSFSLNYCNGKLTGISFDCSAIRCCCDNETDKDCCDDTVVKIEKPNEHNRVYENISLLKVFHSLPLVFTSFPNFDVLRNEYQTFCSFYLRPPLLVTGTSPLYILYSVFKI